MSDVVVVVLAAGRGSRMHSSSPKVCHQVAGKSMLQRVIEVAQTLAPRKIVVIYNDPQIKQMFVHLSVDWITQSEPLGTAHALARVAPHVKQTDRLLVLYGDVPLVTTTTLNLLLTQTVSSALGLVVAQLPDPKGLGRVIRDSNHQVQAIVEEKDATQAQRAITEIFSGIMVVSAQDFFHWWPTIQPANQQGEYYLTDVVALARADHSLISTVEVTDTKEILGVNTRSQLAVVERLYQQKLVAEWMAKGVTFLDPQRVDLRGDIAIGPDTIIDVDVILDNTIIGARSVIGPFSCIRHSCLADDVQIHSHTVIEGAQVAAGCRIGPYARVRPETVLATEVRIGNFVEIKKSHIGSHSKISHLSYVGDAIVGQNVNIGAGVITVNYDGINKHQTIIEDEAFIGCGSQLVAPVCIGTKAFVGAGSTITKSAPADQLVLSRSKQKVVSHWRRPSKLTT